jgi:hypothetical protein
LILAAAASAQPDISRGMAANRPGCASWNELRVEFRARANSPAVDQRLIAVWQWFEAAVKNPGADPASLFKLAISRTGEPPREIPIIGVEILGGRVEDWTPDPRRPDPSWRPPDGLLLCLALARRLPHDAVQAVLEFPEPGGKARPKDLADPIQAELQGPPLPGKPPDPRKPGSDAKGFERELDFAAVLLSSVKDAASAGTTVRARDTKAVADLRFAPVLRARWLSRQAGDRLVTFFTPFAAEVKASNQPIKRDTLSANRIVMGPEYELRWYLKNARGGVTDNALRLILKANNASDRDFKVNEPKFAAEFRPVWGRANRPALDEKYVKKVRGFRYTPGDRIGRTLAPVVGFEAGNSYVRGVPASAIEIVGRFQRAYFGIEGGVNLSGRLALSSSQLLYMRGEYAANRWVHYSKNAAEWTFMTSRAQFSSGLFVTYEKGRLPPFNSFVNSVNVGIRVQSSRWGFSGWR